MGVKLIVVCFLALFMAIPSFFVNDLVRERTSRAADVTKEISSHVGGPQTFLGPTLAIPYTIPPQTPSEMTRRGVYLVSPVQGSAIVKTVTEERRRSLFRVPVFQADLKLDAAFDLKGVPSAAAPGTELNWSLAEIIVGVSDPRGALADATLTADNKTTALMPAQVAQSFSLGGDENHPDKLVLFGAKVNDIARPDAAFHVTSTLRFSGAGASPCSHMARRHGSKRRETGGAQASMAEFFLSAERYRRAVTPPNGLFPS